MLLFHTESITLTPEGGKPALVPDVNERKPARTVVVKRDRSEKTPEAKGAAPADSPADAANKESVDGK